MKEAAQTGAPIEHVCEMYHIDWVYARDTPRKAAMTDRCIHGFEEQHCAACRRCPHGIFESRCATCRPKTAREATVMLANNAPRPSEEHRGYEISYVENERSWYIRADADAPLSRITYRSAFQARRAIDEILDRPAPVAVGGGKKKR